MKSVLVFLQASYLFSTTILGQSIVFRNDYVYNLDANAFLKYHEIPANWHDARLRCHLEGAMLASPTDDKITASLSSIIQSCKTNHCGIFTGIHATFSKGDYRTIDGLPLKNFPHAWYGTEPNNPNDSEDCLILRVNGGLADVNCRDTYPYICAKKAHTVKKMNLNCGTTDSDYLDYVAQTGSCYKFHLNKRNWTRAYMACEAEGAHLIIINSETEAGIVRELFAKYGYDKLSGTIAFAGYHDFEERGDFLTIHGQALKEAGYAVFNPGQPDNAGRNQPCGGLFAPATLDDMWCDSQLAFICEKNPLTLVRDEVVKSCRPAGK